jgi:transcription initiation factor TFIID subunit 2
VDDTAVEFTHSDAVDDLNLGTNTTIAHHQVYKSKYLNALREADEGELLIQLPTDYIKQVKKKAVMILCVRI